MLVLFLFPGVAQLYSNGDVMEEIDFSDLNDETVEKYDFAKCYTRMNPEKPFNPRDVVAAILVTKGNMSQSARLLGRNSSSLRQFIDRNSEIRLINMEIRDELLDDLETGIFVSALKGDQADRRFVLSTLGKERGYTTRAQVAGKDDGPIKFADGDPKERLTSRITSIVDRLREGKGAGGDDGTGGDSAK